MRYVGGVLGWAAVAAAAATLAGCGGQTSGAGPVLPQRPDNTSVTFPSATTPTLPCQEKVCLSPAPRTPNTAGRTATPTNSDATATETVTVTETAPATSPRH